MARPTSAARRLLSKVQSLTGGREEAAPPITMVPSRRVVPADPEPIFASEEPDETEEVAEESAASPLSDDILPRGAVPVLSRARELDLAALEAARAAGARTEAAADAAPEEPDLDRTIARRPGAEPFPPPVVPETEARVAAAESDAEPASSPDVEPVEEPTPPAEPEPAPPGGIEPVPPVEPEPTAPVDPQPGPLTAPEPEPPVAAVPVPTFGALTHRPESRFAPKPPAATPPVVAFTPPVVAVGPGGAPVTEPVAETPSEAEPTAAEPTAAEPTEDALPEPDRAEDTPSIDQTAEAESEDVGAVDAGPAEPDPVESEPIDAELVEDEPIDAEPVEAELVEAEPIDAEPVEAEPVEAELVEDEPIEDEPIEAEPIEAEPIEAEPIDAEPVEAEPVETSPSEDDPIGIEIFEPEPEDATPVAPRPAAPPVLPIAPPPAAPSAPDPAPPAAPPADRGERSALPAPVPASEHRWHGREQDSDDERTVVPVRPRRRRLLIGAGIAAGVLVIGGALVAVPLLVPGGGDDGAVAGTAADPAATDEAIAWIASSVDPDSVLLVEDDLVPDVTAAGFPADTIVAESTLAAAAPDSAWRVVEYVLATPALLADASGETATALENSEAVVSFGSGDSAVEVRRVLADGADQAAADDAVLTAARASAGGQLATNPALTATPAARELLEAGRVDSRLLLLLGQQLAASGLSVADFPAGAGETDGVRHQMLLSGFNGADIPGDTAATASATAWLDSQTGDFVPTSVESTDAGLLVILDLDEPSGLLPGAP